MTMELQAYLKTIRPADPAAMAACQAHWDGVAKPVGSLGKLEDLLVRVAGATGSPAIDLGKKAVLVFCADNGVLAQGVAQSDHTVTTAIARSLAAGTASVNVMAKAAGASVLPVDMGMIDTVPGLRPCKLASGTGDISQGPAMTRAQAEEAIGIGIRLVEEQKAAGLRLLATGEAGIGNTTTSSAVASVLLGLDPALVTGRGSGLTDEGLQRKEGAIRRALAVNAPDPADPVDALAKVGGFDLAAMTGAFLGGAVHGLPVVADGFISAVAALCAVRLCPAAADYILPSHVSAEPAGRLVLEALGFDPVLHGGMRLGEGTGAVALFPLLDLAAAVYGQAASFGDIQVEPYRRWDHADPDPRAQ